MKKIINSTAIIIIGVLALYFYKITLIIIVLIAFLVILAIINGMISDNKLKRFRSKNNGNYYLWYSSNKRLKEIIEKKLKPLIDEKYEVIYNNREQIQSKLTVEEVMYLRKESNSIKFPIMIKIGIDRIHAESFFEEVSEYKIERISGDVFEKKILLKLNKIKNE